MIIHQEHFGRRFYQDKKTGYWISTNYPRIRAHRWVWISLHGTIPPGYHIHHKDENKSNNSIENLELIERSRHFRHHYTEERKEYFRKISEKYRPLTKAWHRSEEGRAWHRCHAIKNKFGKGEFIDYICETCGISFKSRNKGKVRFCHNKCKSKWRRQSGRDDIEAKCGKCGTIFKLNKYSKQKYCSKSCSPKRGKCKAALHSPC